MGSLTSAPQAAPQAQAPSAAAARKPASPGAAATSAGPAAALAGKPYAEQRAAVDPAKQPGAEQQAAALKPAAALQPVGAGAKAAKSEKISEVDNQFYGHGAFMGAAPELLRDPRWSRILKALMPDVWGDVDKALRSGEKSTAIIPMLENNPVMAAYGAWQTKAMDDRAEGGKTDRIGKQKAMEWDCFLPAGLVGQWKAASSPEQKAKITPQLVDNMVIAHGNQTSTVLENKTWWRQYDGVRATRKSGYGGVMPADWVDLFGKALQLAGDPQWQQKAAQYEDPKQSKRVNTPDDQTTDKTFKDKLSLDAVLALYKKTFGVDKFSVILDVKSRDATPAVLKALVGELNKRGVHVEGAGDFVFSEIEGLSQMQQTVGGKTYEGPKEIKFFHFAGELQQACASKGIKSGNHVMFNAASLISYDRLSFGPGKQASYAIKADVVKQLAEWKQKFGFHLGLYVQESDIDPRAAQLITETCNKEAGLVDLGFAWGGLSGKVAADVAPSLTSATIGDAGQHWVGKQWDPEMKMPKGKV